VQLNSGIIERRRQRWEAAEAHFLLAQARGVKDALEGDDALC
jgi:hypothetical protein